jgi:hypothetical protein
VCGKEQTVTSSEQDLRWRVADHAWWHTIELAPGVVTPGWWDLRPTAARLPWPGSLAGLRCLDVGTMDGFWAFELERRGAGEVHAIDLVDPAKQDAPYDQRLKRDPTPLAQLRGQSFRAAAELLGSHVQYHDLNVYDLDPGGIGQFDLCCRGRCAHATRLGCSAGRWQYEEAFPGDRELANLAENQSRRRSQRIRPMLPTVCWNVVER